MSRTNFSLFVKIDDGKKGFVTLWTQTDATFDSFVAENPSVLVS